LASKKIIVVGGGAAGMMAAGQAALSGAEVILMEKMRQLGRKLTISGKGRCNITNTAPQADFIEAFSPNGQFLRQAFAQFFSADLISFFRQLGVETVSERGGRVFPASSDALEIVQTLTKFIKNAGVKILLNSVVRELMVKNFLVIGVKALIDRSSKDSQQMEKKMDFWADAVIITTGGLSYPKTGSTGDGYQLAQSVGHKIIPLRPALVPLVTAGDTETRLAGLTLRNVQIKIFFDGKKANEAFGEMTFTDFGISGPIILSVSRSCVDALNSKKHVLMSIDLKPALDEQKLDKRLLRDLEQFSRLTMNKILKNLLPQKLIPVCLQLTNIPTQKLGYEITAKERKKLRNWLKEFSLEITGYRPFAEAIITAGGVSTREINPRTMESRLIKNLYFAGEILDIDANTGGYNLQAAFSTGWVAGRSAAT
jgi:predicted Rossmann fold flavoprotein